MARHASGVLTWFIAGLIAGCLASIGAFVGGLLFGFLLPGNGASWMGSIVAVAVGGTALLVAGHLVAPRRRFGL